MPSAKPSGDNWIYLHGAGMYGSLHQSIDAQDWMEASSDAWDLGFLLEEEGVVNGWQDTPKGTLTGYADVWLQISPSPSEPEISDEDVRGNGNPLDSHHRTSAAQLAKNPVEVDLGEKLDADTEFDLLAKLNAIDLTKWPKSQKKATGLLAKAGYGGGLVKRLWVFRDGIVLVEPVSGAGSQPAKPGQPSPAADPVMQRLAQKVSQEMKTGTPVEKAIERVFRDSTGLKPTPEDVSTIKKLVGASIADLLEAAAARL